MFQRREVEPDYALLNDPASEQKNRYGKAIDLTKLGEPLHGQSLNINGDSAIGNNPNRYKQHGFYFNTDNCIACHACESACSEKNDNPAHLAFRSVGFIEGGSYPNVQRLNISMACNHCDNPVCLKGCPTRAYTKFAEYGAVLQDPDICFGCGYCTWVCPYNAPQLDPVKGQVTKCNMCVDRLEVGLKPACVSACLGKALDFGVIENRPEGSDQSQTSIPGFPRTDITHPNIRFQQTRTTPREMRRLDQAPLKYHKEEGSQCKNGEKFQSELDSKHGFKRSWNLKKLLGSHENAHITFTLTSQMVMGAFFLIALGMWVPLSPLGPLAIFQQSSLIIPTSLILLTGMSVGLFKLNMHLGKPHRFYRGFYNLRYSPVSREIAGVTLFFIGLAGFTLFSVTELLFDNLFPSVTQELFTGLALLGGGVGGYFMIRLYRIPTRPYWDHWHTAATFVGTALSLGALLLFVISLSSAPISPELGRVLAMVMAFGVTLEGFGLLFHFADLKQSTGEGAASIYEQRTTFGLSYLLRNGMMILSLLLIFTMAWFNLYSVPIILSIGVIVVTASIIGRALFYVLVIPTTMPGAFFWKNQEFMEHAVESELSSMTQLGVEKYCQHTFKLNALIEDARSLVQFR